MKRTLLALSIIASTAIAADTDWSGLKFRNIGVAAVSGRVSDIAVDPKINSRWFVAAASGGLWKTENAGSTWTPIFDGEGSYSIGSVKIDPNNRDVIWVGTGENNSQRSVSYGDGVYKSVDGGNSWTNVGLKESEHIGMITIDPRNSQRVFVAAQGPLWKDGGDRGLYRTEDGGKTWKKVLEVSVRTGINEVIMDPRNPDVMYASSYQRRRHVWTLINGGPESAIYKSIDGGSTWQKLENGIPGEDKGKIGLALSPSNPDVVYAIVESINKKGGVYRSTNGGASFEKRGDYMSGSPQYYNELFVDPHNENRVYSMDTFLSVSEDGGKTFSRLGSGEKWKHVDNHALWIDPVNTNHLVAGCDGGVYVSWDRGVTWDFAENLPLGQFYRATVDNAQPFYHIYGGTQDNNSLGLPSRTMDQAGILNADVYITQGGDGFKTQVDPVDPNILYAQAQHGALVRMDKRSGDAVDIQPQPGPNESLRFNWDSPLIVSPHNPHRLYFAAQKIFRSDDRGNSWKAISPDLSKQLDRNQLKVFDRVWSTDTVAKNASTSFYGSIVALDESPLQEGLIYAGTDDGLIQVSEDGGKQWRKVDNIKGVPPFALVSDVKASLHDRNTVYASFDVHQMGDFKPYVFVSRDRGISWQSLSNDLPARGTVYTLAQDHVQADLLFAGTEFGFYFSQNGGKKWQALKGGLPTITIKDIAIQRRENDLVLGSFGRGFYVLDDYSPLRSAPEKATLYAPRKTWMYTQRSRMGLPGKSMSGDTFYADENPPFGAVFTYYMPEKLSSLKDERQEKDKALKKDNKDTPYATWTQLRAEDNEEAAAIVLIVRDQDGNVVRRINGSTGKGFQRITWDLRLPAFDPASLTPYEPDNAFDSAPVGPFALPGKYSVSLEQRHRGVTTEIAKPVSFDVEHVNNLTIAPADRTAMMQFLQKAGELFRAVSASEAVLSDVENRLKYLRKAWEVTNKADNSIYDDMRRLDARLLEMKTAMRGDATVGRRNEPTAPGISARLSQVVYGSFSSHQGPTQTHREQYDIAASEFARLHAQLKTFALTDLVALEQKMEQYKAPYTPARFPDWTP